MNLKIDFCNRQRKEQVGDDLRGLVAGALRAAFEYEGLEGDAEVSVTFVSDAGIRRFNREYRGIDRATDVLSFPLFEGGDVEDAFDGEEYQLGDVVLSLERARAQSELYGHSFEREVAFLCVHSALHLMGYDHERGESDEQDMRRRQRDIMKILGLEVSSED
ncbi:MAG: rRNA maturation RNase YbeY [Eubacteriales bacterium]|nr:rRNA maturation RNase YbeY [Clostridiales bacterium]MDD7594454.1 rRNA maturation RNase YbeY [Clostridiales bacterium]MDY4887487.1 rRNA maturation RNase YbeY [Eubacteriales bacterium]MDY5861410.1 rRNA maturation RNase YbeY [Eubacteriales bacterium]HCG67282.1 rRNA maturation RNase YbeY [Clostridiales bacterium]